MNDRSLVMVMTQGIGAHLTNDEKRAHLLDLKLDTSLIRSIFKRFCHPKKRKKAASMQWHLCNSELKCHGVAQKSKIYDML
jgi:hypothetical protein